MNELVAEYSYVAVILVFIAEQLIAASKLKSNSTTELVINVIKYIFGMKK